MCHVLYSRLCGDYRIGTITKILYIYYPQLSIFPKVCAAYLYFHYMMLSLLFFHILHASISVWCFLGKLNSCIILKVVTLSVTDF